MKLQESHIENIDILNSISVESKSYWGYPKEWIRNWMRDLTLEGKDFFEQHIYHLEKSGVIIGFCSMIENEYEIMHLWIKPKYIGKGYGKLLLNETIQRVVKKEKEIIVESDPNAELFYKKQGFNTFDKIESFSKGRFLPVMKKKLKEYL